LLRQLQVQLQLQLVVVVVVVVVVVAARRRLLTNNFSDKIINQNFILFRAAAQTLVLFLARSLSLSLLARI